MSRLPLPSNARPPTLVLSLADDAGPPSPLKPKPLYPRMMDILLVAPLI